MVVRIYGMTVTRQCCEPRRELPETKRRDSALVRGQVDSGASVDPSEGDTFTATKGEIGPTEEREIGLPVDMGLTRLLAGELGTFE